MVHPFLHPVSDAAWAGCFQEAAEEAASLSGLTHRHKIGIQRYTAPEQWSFHLALVLKRG